LFMSITIIVSLNYSFLSAASLSAITRVMIYGIVCTTLILLRKKNPDQANFYKLKHGNIIAVAGILITLWLLSSSRLRELRDVGIAIMAGLVIYILVNRSKKNNH